MRAAPRTAGDAGFTLIEMLVAITLMLVVFGLVLSVTDVFQRQASANEQRGDAEGEARNAVDQMAWLMRNAVTPMAASPAAIERSLPYDVIFLSSDPANAGSKIHVRYCVDSSSPTARLLQQTAPSTAALPATACPDTTTAGWTAASVRPVATHLVNRASSTPAWTYDTRASTIVGVSIDLMVDTDTTKPPPPTRLTTHVALRNVNRPPVAAVSCQLANNRHVVCDASGSSDPEGEQLSYAWSYGSPPIASPVTSYRLDQALSPGTYTFTVTVSDPAGLSSSAVSAPVTVT